MILCPQCHVCPLSEENGRYCCKTCGNKVLIENGIVFFHPEEKDSNSGMQACILDDVAKFEEKHFWMSARRSYLARLFGEFVNLKDAILEIGAGTGYVAKYLINRGYQNYAIGDIQKRGLELSGECVCRHKYQFNLLRPVFAEHFDVVAMFDVLEHISDDNLAVKNINKMLNNGGRAIVTVPAHMWLWSKQDAIVYHRKRYEVKELKELFLRNGFKILKTNGFFFSLIPFMYLRTIINRDDGVINKGDYKDRFRVNSIFNMVLEMVLHIEMVVFKSCFSRYGGSIVLVAEKQRDQEQQ